MTVYIIAEFHIHDRTSYDKYDDAFEAVFVQYKGKILSVDEAPTVLEGDWDNDGEYDAAVDKPLALQTCAGLANGVDTDTLAEWLHGGGTLAQIAEGNGVDQQAVVDLIVGQMTDRLDMAVENGRIDEAEAAEKAADLVERVTTRVTEGRPEGAGEGRGHRGGGHGPRGGGADADGGASDGDAPATTEG